MWISHVTWPRALQSSNHCQDNEKPRRLEMNFGAFLIKRRWNLHAGRKGADAGADKLHADTNQEEPH